MLGAAGGVGVTAVEAGKHIEATVIAAAGSDEKLVLTHEYGADHTVNYTTQIVTVEHPRAGRVRMPSSALGDRAAQTRVRLPPPMIGEHSTEVLASFGLSEEEVGRLLTSGAVVQGP